MNVRAWIIVFLGLWLIVAAYLSLGTHGQETDNLIVGFVVAIVGFSMMRRAAMLGWVAGWLGVWVFMSAFIPPLVDGSGLHVNNVVFGSLIAFTGFGTIRTRKEVF
jgi:hypothetical protein